MSTNEYFSIQRPETDIRIIIEYWNNIIFEYWRLFDFDPCFCPKKIKVMMMNWEAFIKAQMSEYDTLET